MRGFLLWSGVPGSALRVLWCSLQYSLKLAELFQNPVVITHRRGHVVPGLEGEQLQMLHSFLQARMQDSTL